MGEAPSASPAPSCWVLGRKQMPTTQPAILSLPLQLVVHPRPLASPGTDRWKAQLSLPALLQIFGDYYHFWHRAVTKRSLSPHRLRHSRLQREPQVSAALAPPTASLPFPFSGSPEARFLSLLPLLHRLPLTASQVKWLEQQVAKRRAKRDIYQEPTDPKFPQQWYLVRGLPGCLHPPISLLRGPICRQG